MGEVVAHGHLFRENRMSSEPFHYETCCCESTGELINAMRDAAEEISAF
jgi:hypothetical protein